MNIVRGKYGTLRNSFQSDCNRLIEIVEVLTFKEEFLTNVWQFLISGLQMSYLNLYSIANGQQIKPKYRINAECVIYDLVAFSDRKLSNTIVTHNEDLLSIDRSIEQTHNSIEKFVRNFKS
jgi:hypothetical protein